MGRLLLDHSASSSSSSSSSMKSSFLIQMIRWIRGSSRIEFFIFLIVWWIFFEWWELDLQRASSSSESQLKVITSFWHTFLAWMNPMILGGHSRWLSPLLHSPLLLLLLQDVLHSGSSHSSTIFSKRSSELSSYLQIAWSRNKTSSVSLGKTLVLQVDPWLNQQWSSWPWSSSKLCKALSLISVWN